jgi:hypothetical protein
MAHQFDEPRLEKDFDGLLVFRFDLRLMNSMKSSCRFFRTQDIF